MIPDPSKTSYDDADLQDSPLEGFVPDDLKPDGSNRTVASGMGTGVAIGVAIGAVLGVVMDNLGVGIAIGIALGVVIGSVLDRVRKRSI